ncbi:glycosyltransferase [Microbacterium sp. MYb45]|uniref:glycosyltransferase n=1 Tax=Microbacterium sp. MYb45 TaxID=1827294 RepID=UPI0011B05A49|nr:glycosyltransferase [Microbacterium sp. MYb45]
MSRPHLLYTAWSFPPSRAGGVYRALATVNAFAAAGWDVTVLTVPESVFSGSTGTDAALLQEVDGRVRIVRDEPDVPAFQNDLTRWPWLRARQPELYKLIDLRRDLPRFPEPNYGRWRPRLEAVAERIHREHPVDVAIGTANPHVDFIPGWHLNRRFGVRHVMDYRDAWQLDVFSGRRLITATPDVRRWERRLMASADEMWFVNEAIRSWHAAQHPGESEKMHVVANGFDEYGNPLRVPVRDGREQGLVFGYIGTITPKVPLKNLIQGWARARREEPALAGARLDLRGYLGHFGAGEVETQRLVAEAETDGIRYLGPVAKTAISETYRGFDALVLALGTGRYVTSGKVYEYAATGIPVVSVHDPGNAASDVLRGSPSWVPSRSLSVDDIADALAAGARLARDQTPMAREAAQEWAAGYSRTAQLEPRIAALAPR